MLVRYLLLPVLFFSVADNLAAESYISLLNETSLHHWMKPDGAPVTEGWGVDSDGVLSLAGKGGNIVTREEYGDFELWFEFKIAKGGNSGLKYRVKKYGDRTLGLEYQVLDDEAHANATREHHTASLYDLVTPIPSTTRFSPDGEFNIAKIRVQNQRIQHWINGQLMIDEPVGNHSWRENVQNSKFRDHEGFGENHFGRLMLTDHGSQVWYRNIYIKRLDTNCCCRPCRR